MGEHKSKSVNSARHSKVSGRKIEAPNGASTRSAGTVIESSRRERRVVSAGEVHMIICVPSCLAGGRLRLVRLSLTWGDLSLYFVHGRALIILGNRTA
jgi:hypothetical protein